MDAELNDFGKANRGRPLSIEIIPADVTAGADRMKNAGERSALNSGRFLSAEKFSVRFANRKTDTVGRMEEDVSDYFESPFILDGPADGTSAERTRTAFPEISGAYFSLSSKESPDTSFVVTSDGYAWLVSLR